MSADKKMIIGVTGKTKSGKSEACRAMKRPGVKVIDVDKFAHALYKKNMPLWHKLVKLYGKQILDTTGEVDRKILRNIAFKDGESYSKFTQMVYPVLCTALKSKIQNLKSKIVVLDMAVLFETGFYKKADYIIFIKTDEKLRNKRVANMRERVFLNKAAAFQEVFSAFKKVALSDFVICNNGTKMRLEKVVMDVLNKIIPKAGQKRKM